LIQRGIAGAKLKPAEAVDCLDFLHGLSAALPVHQHIGHVLFECAREITAKAAAPTPDLKSSS
jgi:hypothetical protein